MKIDDICPRKETLDPPPKGHYCICHWKETLQQPPKGDPSSATGNSA